MNKLIIAGNGFDLAHGLPTLYNHFIDAFWRDLKDNYEDELVENVIYLDSVFTTRLSRENINNYDDFKELVDIHNRVIEQLNNYTETNIYHFRNQFFKKLNKIQSIQNWVDVENEYYQGLKELCLYEDAKTKANKTIYKEARLEAVLILHKEFEQVKQLLERYLQKNVVEAYDFENSENRSDFCEIIRHYKGKIDIEVIKEFTSEEDVEEMKKFISNPISVEKWNNNLSILNFNYTPTFEKYLSLYDLKIFNMKINHIHGSLNKEIVFGFGDEMDDDYKLIENMDDNEYLRYFKSFQYVQNSNYKDILRYVDSGKFQVIIMGHSCGLSDRTLLNTIFEHDNCRSIKVFYHKYGEKEGEDNYTEVIQNISRHFNDKKLMRTKIVEKTLCEPMPQIQLPKKE